MIHLIRAGKDKKQFTFVEIAKNGEYIGGAGSETFKSRAGVYKAVRSKSRSCYNKGIGYLYIQDDTRTFGKQHSRMLKLDIEGNFAPKIVTDQPLKPKYKGRKKGKAVFENSASYLNLIN